MYAVIRTGGKQYRVEPGEILEIERLRSEPGETVTFAPLLVVDGSAVKAQPVDLEGLSVRGEVVGHKRGRKIRVFNYKSKGGWKKTRGHRQELTTVKITEIG